MKLIQHSRPRRAVAGFTLIEMITSMAITGILAAIVGNFLVGPVRGYFDTASRGALSDTADMTLRRLSREVRQALPNSLRVATSNGYVHVEFIATSGGGAYRDVMDGAVGGNPLNFSDGATTCATDATLCQFDVVGEMPGSPPISAGDYIVVYNLGQDSLGNSYAPADAYATGDPCIDCNRAKVAPGGVVGNTVTLEANAGGVNVFAAAVPPMLSPSNRFHVVPGGAKAVTFACPTTTPGPFYRYVNYGFHPAQSDAIANLTGGSRFIMANSATCNVTYTEHASQRNGLLVVTLNLQAPKTSGAEESATLVREIHVDNSP